MNLIEQKGENEFKEEGRQNLTRRRKNLSCNLLHQSCSSHYSLPAIVVIIG